jgi:hypothetical protein
MSAYNKWTHIPQTALTALNSACALTFPPHTPVDTDEDRTAMGIPNYDTRPTPVPKPADIPEVEALTVKLRVLGFRFRRANMKRWGKPENVHGKEGQFQRDFFRDHSVNLADEGKTCP